VKFYSNNGKYLNTVSKRTGNVATNKKYKIFIMRKPKRFKANSKNNSQPRGGETLLANQS
jgi:hypothetical protein